MGSDCSHASIAKFSDWCPLLNRKCRSSRSVCHYAPQCRVHCTYQKLSRMQKPIRHGFDRSKGSGHRTLALRLVSHYVYTNSTLHTDERGRTPSGSRGCDRNTYLGCYEIDINMHALHIYTSDFIQIETSDPNLLLVFALFLFLF